MEAPRPDRWCGNWYGRFGRFDPRQRSANQSFDPTLPDSPSRPPHQPVSNFFCGTVQNTTTANFAYNQGFMTGTNMLVGFNNTRVAGNNPISTINPSLNSGFQFRLTQHLLQGFGLAPICASFTSRRTTARAATWPSACR